ncbi:MAG TPA: FumA C-terminus/TtdB family hydratase beta subunit [Thermodesulfobacteriota bacterium]|nr:FumA C-terminus/TtdB family hydratase beta subunit [Thermodesulfobacteriota bacterium]
MKNAIQVDTPLTDTICEELNVGDLVLLSGEVITGRDTAHKRLYNSILQGERLPVSLEGEIIFYAAPTPARPGHPIGSIGPTTSSRMDQYTPKLIASGLKGMIGKGKRSAEVREAIKRYKAVYFGAMGGVAALLSRCVKKAEVIAYGDLGPESMMRLKIVNFPVVVVNDTKGRDLYEEAVEKHKNPLRKFFK